MKSIHSAFIPARGGSIGVPGKNIRTLHGKPLILHTIDYAKKSTFFSRIIISTDSAEIATIASNEVVSKNEFSELRTDEFVSLDDNLYLHKRPPWHAETLSPIREVLFEFAKREDILGEFDFLWMLQPTSPFRQTSDLTNIELLMKSDHGWTSITSLTSVGGMHPDRMYSKGQGKYLKAFMYQGNKDNKPRQLLSELFIKDGAFYIFRKEELQKRMLMGDRILPYFREGLKTLNIDTLNDFKIAELIDDPFSS